MKKKVIPKTQYVLQFTHLSKMTIILFILIAIYIITMLSVIQWGIPGSGIVYPYHMDEWHQFMAVKSLAKNFSNNIAGASRGPMFFYVQTLLFLGPFVLLHIIHPSILVHHFTSVGLTELHHVYILLRLYILLLGILTLILIYLISKQYLHTNPLLAVVLFGATPLWISWSNYFKYDVAVVFWIVFSLYFFLRYKSNPTNKTFYITGIIVALTVATKISAAPLTALYVVSFLLFTPKPLQYKVRLFIGLLILCVVFVLCGIPDILFLGKNWGDYIVVDIVNRRSTIFGVPWYIFFLTEQYPIIFGYGLYFLIIISGIYYLTKIRIVFKKTVLKKYNSELFLASGLLVFCVSLIPLEAGAISERVLVLLPFLVLLVTISITRILQMNKRIFIPVLCIILAIQLFETYTWVSIKLSIDPKVTSSKWITHHLVPGTQIAIENIPIYQGLPNVVLTDYYNQQSKTTRGIYRYSVIDTPKVTAPYVLITNAAYKQQLFPSSPDSKMISHLAHDGYRQLAIFKPDLSLYSYFGDERNFYFAGLIPTNTIAIYAKTH